MIPAEVYRRPDDEEFGCLGFFNHDVSRLGKGRDDETLYLRPLSVLRPRPYDFRPARHAG